MTKNNMKPSPTTSAPKTSPIGTNQVAANQATTSSSLTIVQRGRRRFRRVVRRFDDYSACIVLALAAGTMLSAFIGVIWGGPSKASDAKAKLEATVRETTLLDWFRNALNWFTDALYEAVQVILLNMETHVDEFNVFIGMARVGAVCLAIMVGLEGIRRLFKSSFEYLKISLFGDNMVFIAGLGRIGLEVARNRVANNDFVVALELADANHWTDQAKEDGVLVKHGDVNNNAVLETVVAKNPREYFLVTGNDQININALARIRSLRCELEAEQSGSTRPGVCYVHIDDAALYKTLCRSLAEQQKAGISDKGLTVHYFNICHETACELIVEDLTALRPKDSDQVALYIVFGFEQMGQAMVKELVEFAHFENQKRPRILALSKDQEVDADRCLARWPRMSPRFVHDSLSAVMFESASDNWFNRSARPLPEFQIADERAVEYAANVHFCKLDDYGTLSQSDVASIVALATAEHICPVVLFCYEEDDVNFKMATEFCDLLSDFHGINRFQNDGSRTIPCRVFLPRSRALREVLKGSPESRFLSPFGSVAEGLTRAQDTLVEELGMVYAWAYDKHSALTNAKKDNNKTPAEIAEIAARRFNRQQYIATWHGKEFWDRYSNCAAAEHAWIKLKILELDVNALAKLTTQTFSHEDKSLIAYIEHNRWLAERLLMGWSYGERSDSPPRRLSICPKSTLSQDELEKDFAQIQAMCAYFIDTKSST